jgi:hypothetical protein
VQVCFGVFSGYFAHSSLAVGLLNCSLHLLTPVNTCGGWVHRAPVGRAAGLMFNVHVQFTSFQSCFEQSLDLLGCQLSGVTVVALVAEGK